MNASLYYYKPFISNHNIPNKHKRAIKHVKWHIFANKYLFHNCFFFFSPKIKMKNIHIYSAYSFILAYMIVEMVGIVGQITL